MEGSAPRNTDRTPPAPTALIGPLTRLLRPLVRLLIRSGITFPVLADLLRSLYVEVAAQDLLPDPKTRTDSRISLLTGVHRKEIRRLRTSDPPEEATPAIVTLSSQIIARWLGAPAYRDGTGSPRPLPRTRAAAVGVSFEGLVESVTTDVRARAVLDDWIAQGIVTLDAADDVHLNTNAFIPRPGSAEQLFYFARNLHDHIAAGAANILGNGVAPFLDRSLHYDQLSPTAAAKLETAARDKGQRLLVALNRTALRLAEADRQRKRPAGGRRRRVNLGVYLYSEDEAERDPP